MLHYVPRSLDIKVPHQPLEDRKTVMSALEENLKSSRNDSAFRCQQDDTNFFYTLQNFFFELYGKKIWI